MPSSINLAFLKIAKRAERQDDAVLAKTFVDFGAVTSALSSVDHHIIYGRRGTGKTHLLTVLRKAQELSGTAALQIDMRNLGSAGGLYADPSLPTPQRATRLLVDVLSEIHSQLFTLAISDDSKIDLSAIGNDLDELFDAHRSVKVVGTTSVETTAAAENSQNAESKIGLAGTLTSVSFASDFKGAAAEKESVSAKRTVTGSEVYRVNFGNIGNALRKVVGHLPEKRLWILID